MAKTCCFNGKSPTIALHFHSQTRTPPLQLRKQHCSNSYTPSSRNTCAIYNMVREKNETPQVLKIAVSGVTELLRLFSPPQQTSVLSDDIEKQNNDSTVSSVEDVLIIIKSDYDNDYFVTGNFTSSIYTENCIFEDPTIKFSGRDLYARNLKLLVPFFDCASIKLLKIEKEVESDTNFLRASWKLRTNLKLPWRPLIAIDGSTSYELNEDFKIVRHVESWNVSALEAVLQIFKFEKPGG
ncbi:putative NTF2-like domain-containing protein [Medicago truncatula]|uniref:DUF2358 family protein n=1 Tax=Medicago truncatula TaxID=3880 RepID=G7I6W9_MEDTR|nr:uncharacterized protein LOC11412057 isoform X1 [Medicago truncatula]AES61264.1 DUF2358 family protein [Medicago truncatula]RHN80682.1 putative NTF2-like domain-containing protein [Medicago truncatula]